MAFIAFPGWLFSQTTTGSQNDSASVVVLAGMDKDSKNVDRIFYKVEKEAMFPGGIDGWRNYLEHTLKSNVAAKEGLPPGVYSVGLQFVVDRTGNVMNVNVVSGSTCKRCEVEALRVLKKSPKWEPAIQSGRNVPYMASQKISFIVE